MSHVRDITVKLTVSESYPLTGAGLLGDLLTLPGVLGGRVTGDMVRPATADECHVVAVDAAAGYRAMDPELEDIREGRVDFFDPDDDDDDDSDVYCPGTDLDDDLDGEPVAVKLRVRPVHSVSRACVVGRISSRMRVSQAWWQTPNRAFGGKAPEDAPTYALERMLAEHTASEQGVHGG